MNLETKTQTKNSDLSAVLTVEIDEKLAKPPSPKGLDLDEPDEMVIDKVKVVSDKVKVDPDDGGIDEIEGLDEDEDDNTYVFVTSDNKRFEMDKQAATLSELAKTMIEGDKNERVLPMPNVHSSIMVHIVKFLKYHANNPIPEGNSPEKLKSNVFSENIKCSWDVKFIEGDVMSDPNAAKENLYSLIRASNYMDIQPLLQLACTKVACMIKGESLEAIKKIISTDVPYVDNHKAGSS